MNIPSRTQTTIRPSANRRIIGPSSTFLLLGFLAGMFVGHSSAAATMTWAAMLTVFAIAANLAMTKIVDYFAQRAQRKAANLATAELERRMERLIPRQRVIAHGTHLHSPHGREETENDWMPVALRGRGFTSHR